MSSVVKFPDLELIEEQACDWIARLDRGLMSEAQHEQLHAWLGEDSRHGDALLEMARLLDQTTVLAELESMFPLDDSVAADAKPPRLSDTWSMGRLLTMTSATAAVLLVAVWGFQFFGSTANVTPASISTSVGEMKTVPLADGSTVTLNTNSTMSVDYSSERRQLILHQGEALFEVAHDKHRPFIVEADGSLIKAVGTAFNVEIGRRNVEVVVTDGVVEIESLPAQAVDNNSHSTTETDTSASSATRVSAGEIAVIDEVVTTLLRAEVDAIDVKLAWKQGQLVFQGESLEQVVAEVSRYTDQSIVIVDDSIRNMRIGGRFEAGDIENLLDILEFGFNIESTRSDVGEVFLSSRYTIEN